MPWSQGPTDHGANCTYNVIVYGIYALIMKQVNCRCQAWPIPKVNAEKLKYAQCAGGYDFHIGHQ